jgi:hypothetical protein
MAFEDSLSELTDFLLRMFHHPSYDHTYPGAPYVQTQRDIQWTLDKLNIEKDKASRAKLLSELEGHVLIFNTVSYYGDKERDQIIDKIQLLRKEI